MYEFRFTQGMEETEWGEKVSLVWTSNINIVRSANQSSTFICGGRKDLLSLANNSRPIICLAASGKR